MKRRRFALALAATVLVLACGAKTVAPAPPPTVPADAATASSSELDATPEDAGFVALVGAERSIAALRPRFRACYQKGLQRDAKMEGKVVVGILVASDGSVTQAEEKSNTGLSREVCACITAVLKSAEFNAPGPGHASVMQVPVAFFASERDAGVSKR